MALAGNVETISLSSIFKFISTNHLSGHFTLKSEEGESSFLFADGNIFFPFSSRRTSYSLGGIIRGTKRVPKDLLEKIRGQSDDSLADALVDGGAVSQSELEQARRMQFEEEIYDGFLWKRAFFEFAPGSEPEGMKQALESRQGHVFNTTSILMEAARREDSMMRIRAIVPSQRTILRVNPGREGDVDKVLRDADIDGSHRSFDSRAPLEEVLRAWNVPSTRALTAIADLVESEALVPLGRGAALTRFRKEVEVGAIPQALNDLSYLLDTEPEDDDRHQLGVEKELIDSKEYKTYTQEGGFSAKLSGARAFRIMHHYFNEGVPFTAILRLDENEKRISYNRHQLAVASTSRTATPKLVHYLQRTGAISADEAKTLWKVSGKALHDTLLGEKRIEKSQWIEGLAEKVSEELVELYYWPSVQVEFLNRAGKVMAVKRPMKINLPMPPEVRKQIRSRLNEFEDMVRAVPAEEAIFVRRHPDLPPPHPFYKRFDGQRPLADIRRYARAGPIEFTRFVFQGVKKRTLRAVTLDEMVKGAEEALSREDHRKALRLVKSIKAFSLQKLVQDLVERVEKETAGLEIGTTVDRLRGDLQHFSLAEILQTLSQDGLTGTLRLTDGSQEQILYFYRGIPHLLKVEQEDEDEDFLDLFSGDDDGEGGLADTFFGDFDDSGGLSEAELESIREQTLNVFFWKDARFEFIRNELPDAFWESDLDDKITRVRLETNSFLMEVLGKLHRLDEIRREIPTEECLPEFVSMEKKMEVVGMNTFPEVVMIIDGRHTVAQLSRATSESRFDLYQFLYSLIEGGQVKVNLPQDFAKAWD